MLRFKNAQHLNRLTDRLIRRETPQEKMMRRLSSLALFSLLLSFVAHAQKASTPIGLFEGQKDIGAVLHPGSAVYDPAARSYTVSGSGENMWFAKDDFHFVWTKQENAEISLSVDLEILGAAAEGHRKGVLMIRQSLDADSTYVDIARHGDGLTSLQFRDIKGGITREVESDISGPVRLRLEKHGDRFFMWIGDVNNVMQFAGGSARVKMTPPFYVGIGVCAHQKDAVETVRFTNVALEVSVIRPPAAYSTVETVLLSGDARVGFVSKEHLTTPGWGADGHTLTFESGAQRREVPFVPLKTAAPVGLPTVKPSGNQFVYLAVAQNGGLSSIYRQSTAGAESELFFADDFNNFAPGLSPDGKYLVLLSTPRGIDLKPNQEMSLRVLTLADHTIKTLTTFTGGPDSLGPQPWSPDGKRIVFVSYQPGS